MQPFYAIIVPTGLVGAHPEHPIAPGGQPPSVWPGPGPLPHPEHPIVLPPNAIWPEPGPLPGVEHPIVIPPVEPDQKPPQGEVKLVEWHTVWTEQEGWIIVGIPQGDHPTPSAKRGK